MTPIQKIGAALFVFAMLVVTALAIFIEWDQAKTEAKEATCYIRPSTRNKPAACPEDDEAARRIAA
jgi:hypothetical protein